MTVQTYSLPDGSTLLAFEYYTHYIKAYVPRTSEVIYQGPPTAQYTRISFNNNAYGIPGYIVHIR